MDSIKFFVPGNPKGLKRHRMTKTGHRYDPSKSEKMDFLAKALEHRPPEPLREQLAVALICIFPRPKSHYRTGKHADELRPDAPRWYASAPDLDNVLKFVGDALNAIFWKDDRQIVAAGVYQVYGIRPGIAVSIMEPGDAHFNRMWWHLVDICGQVEGV